MASGHKTTIKMGKTFVTTLFIFFATFAFSQTRNKADAKKLADDLYLKATSGQHIKTLARLYSEDPGSAKDGGLVQFKPGQGQIIASFENEILKLDVGQISKPFLTEFGYHIAQVVTKADTLIQLRHVLVTFKK